MALGLLRVVPVWAWALAAVLAWGGWQRHQATSQTKARAAAEQAAAVATATEQAQRQARATEQALNTRARKATDAAHHQARTAAAAAAAARAELERLRAVLPPAAAASAAAADPGATGGADAATAGPIVAQCAAQLVAVATDADACGATLIGLQGWVRAVLAPPPDDPQ
jgi:hypothetical protein